MQDCQSSDPPQSEQVRRALPPLEQAIQLAQEGDRERARELLRSVIRSEPNSEEAWVWLAWVAESEAVRSRYLREAQALLPDSQRIREALDWAKQQSHVKVQPSAASAAQPSSTLVDRGVKQMHAVSDRVDRAVDATQENVARVVDAVRETADRVRMPDLDAGRWRRVLVPLISLLLIVALFTIAWGGVQNARQVPSVVRAITLPTPVIDATATPSVDQRCKSLWVQVDVAWNRQNWDAAIDVLQRIRSIDPYSEEARLRLGEAHYYRGISYVQTSALEEARLELDTAVRLNAKSADLQQVRRELDMYLAGLASFQEQSWQTAVSQLLLVYDQNPGFRDTQDMLGTASFEYGQALRAQERWDESYAELGRAVALLPDNEVVRKAWEDVGFIITPPKRIEVDISDKTVTLYENNQPAHIFPVCTGRATAPTVPGNYEVLEKLPLAYASKWDLDMPHWLGIYWAGGSQNGFHALPLRGGTQVIWADSLGTGCSFGCIVLETSQAKFLYDWAEVGDKVIITR